MFLTLRYMYVQLLCLSNKYNNLRHVEKWKTQSQFPKYQLLYIY